MHNSLLEMNLEQFMKDEVKLDRSVLGKPVFIFSSESLYNTPDGVKEMQEKTCNHIRNIIGYDIQSERTYFRSDVHPLESIILSAARMEQRDNFIQSLEECVKELDERIAHSKGFVKKRRCQQKKEILKKSISKNKALNEEIYISIEGIRDLSEHGNLEADYVTIHPLVRAGSALQEALDYLEEQGMYNIAPFRKLPEQLPWEWDRASYDGLNVAAAYLSHFKENALDHILKRLPLVSIGQHYYENKHILEITEQKSFKKEAKRLHVDLRHFDNLFISTKYAISNQTWDLQLYRFLKQNKSFYHHQLKTGTEEEKWTAVFALARGCNGKSHKSYNGAVGWPDPTKKAKRSFSRYLNTIIEEMDLTRYPNLVSEKGLLLNRLLCYTFNQSELKRSESQKDPFELEVAESIISLKKRFDSELAHLGLSCSLEYLITHEKSMSDIQKYHDALRCLSRDFPQQAKRFLQKDYSILNLQNAKHIESLAQLKHFTEDYSSFGVVEEIEEMIGTYRLDAILNAYYIYCDVLGKPFEKFVEGIKQLDTHIFKIFNISESLKKSLEPARYISVLNHVVKKRSKDLINALNQQLNPLSAVIAEMDGSKSDSAKYIAQANYTWNYLKEMNSTHLADDILTNISKRKQEYLTFSQAMRMLRVIRKKTYTDFLEHHEIPSEYKEEYELMIMAYHTLSDDRQETKRNLKRIALATLSVDNPWKKIDAFPENKKIVDFYAALGIDLSILRESYMTLYNAKTAHSYESFLSEKIEMEQSIITNRLEALHISPVTTKLSPAEYIERVHEVLEGNNDPLAREIRGHLLTIGSLRINRNQKDKAVHYYISTDPIEGLMSGQYFKTCISLVKHHSAINAWAAVTQIYDSNKVVMYAKTEDDVYVGRQRAMMTDKGLICTSFYQNGNLDLSSGWVDFFTHFYSETGVPIIIPEGYRSAGKIFKRFPKKNMTLYVPEIERNRFYTDGLFPIKSQNNPAIIDGIFSVIGN
jgi:hypothetical protein